MEKTFSFYIGTEIIYGIGSSQQINSILQENDFKNIGIIVDHNIIDNNLIAKILLDIKKISKIITIEQCEMSEPTYQYLENIRRNFMGKGIQVMIGIGGGSTIDTAKAIAVLINNKRSAISYRGFNKMKNPVLPIIAIPTTAGTGSEITPNASFIDDKEMKKMGINGEAVRPKYALIDPALTLSCPKDATISAAIDSVVHAVEAYVAKKSNAMAKMLAKEGLRYVCNNLLKVIAEPNNIEFRDKVMYGAFLSGIALMNSGTGPAAAMSYPLGVHYKVPHGIAGGIFLPFVIEYNINKRIFDYADLYDILPGKYKSKNTSKAEKARYFLKSIRAIWKRIGRVTDLAEYQFPKSFPPIFIQETLELKTALDQNPILFDHRAINWVLSSLIKAQ